MNTRVYHLNRGSFSVRAAILLDRRRGLLEGFVRCVSHCLLVETAHSGLVDVGLSTNEVADPKKVSPLIRFELGPRFDYGKAATARVKTPGFRPEDVRHVVLTRLDLDHAAGLADFPWAIAHASSAEQRAVRFGKDPRYRIRYDRAVLKHPHWKFYDVKENLEGDGWFGLRGLNTVAGLADDVALMPLPGHSPGHCGVAVQTREGWLLHAADAYLHRDELLPPPDGPATTGIHQRVVQVSSKLRRESLEQLRKLRQTYNDEVAIFCSHDEVEFQRLAGIANPNGENVP